MWYSSIYHHVTNCNMQQTFHSKGTSEPRLLFCICNFQLILYVRYLCSIDSLVTHFSCFRDIQLDSIIAWRGHCPRWLPSPPSTCICHFLLPELVSANPAGQGHTRQCCHVLLNLSFSKPSFLESSVSNSRPRFLQRPTKQERQVHVRGSSFGQPLQLPILPLGPSQFCAFDAKLGSHSYH